MVQVSGQGLRNDSPAKRSRLRPRRVLPFLDALAAVITLVAAPYLMRWKGITTWSGYVAHLVGLLLILVITLLLLLRDGQYSVSVRMSRLADLVSLLKCLAIASAFVALAALVTKGFFTGFVNPSRLSLGISICIFFGLGVLSRVGLWAYQRSLFARGESLRRVLLLGNGEAADEFLEFLDNRPWLGIKCVGRLLQLVPTLEGLEELKRILEETEARAVVVAFDPAQCSVLPEVTRLLSLGQVRFQVVPSLFEETFASADLTGYAELPVVDFAVDPLDRVQRLFKRALDLAVAGGVLVVGSVFGLFIALAIKLDSRGPVFYMQERVGKNGRRFLMFKFRTMVEGADELVDELQSEDESASEGRLFKIKNDPRITRVGVFLRKWSLDETPQFLNVVRGEMSLVGPRPPRPREVENYETEHLYRLRGMPGITGLWQVSGRSTLTFDEMVKLDRYYLEHWSVGLDLTIMMKTIYVVLKRKGAY